jgi:hypothetical protein
MMPGWFIHENLSKINAQLDRSSLFQGETETVWQSLLTQYDVKVF